MWFIFPIFRICGLFFLSSDDTSMFYLHSDFYNPEYESGLRFDDPTIGIEWPLDVDNVSERDQNLALFIDL